MGSGLAGFHSLITWWSPPLCKRDAKVSTDMSRALKSRNDVYVAKTGAWSCKSHANISP